MASTRRWQKPAANYLKLKARLARGKARKEKPKVEAEIAHILRPRWVSQVVSVSPQRGGALGAAPYLPH